MRYFVTDECISCGACIATCPNVFSFGEDGLAHASDTEVTERDEADAEEAMEGCPVDAIEQIEA